MAARKVPQRRCPDCNAFMKKVEMNTRGEKGILWVCGRCRTVF